MPKKPNKKQKREKYWAEKDELLRQIINEDVIWQWKVLSILEDIHGALNILNLAINSLLSKLESKL